MLEKEGRTRTGKRWLRRYGVTERTYFLMVKTDESLMTALHISHLKILKF